MTHVLHDRRWYIYLWGQESQKISFTSNCIQRAGGQKKTLPRNKKPSNGMQESGIYNDKRIKRGENLITFDGGLKTGKHDWKKEMDVISFTFSSRSAMF